MDVNVTAVKGPSHKTGIKANLFYFSCIALFFFPNELGTWWSNGSVISNCNVITHNCQSCQVQPAGGQAVGIRHVPKSKVRKLLWHTGFGMGVPVEVQKMASLIFKFAPFFSIHFPKIKGGRPAPSTQHVGDQEPEARRAGQRGLLSALAASTATRRAVWRWGRCQQCQMIKQGGSGHKLNIRKTIFSRKEAQAWDRPARQAVGAPPLEAAEPWLKRAALAGGPHGGSAAAIRGAGRENHCLQKHLF